MSVDFIDLNFRGHDRVIATALLTGADGVTLIDPGPTSCLPALEAGLHGRGFALRDVRNVLLTHIHLDHAGATGTICERVPNLRVLVHERGAPHMIDPSRLMASATRLYGDRMESLWGAFQPVPADRVTALQGGERIEVDTSRRRVRERFAELERERHEVVERELRRLRVDHVALSTERDWLLDLGRKLR